MRGVFVWVTCRDVLWHLGRDLYQAGYDSPELPTIPELGQDEKEKRVAALVSSEGLLLDGKNGDSILLEEFEFRAQTDATTQIWADYLARHAMPTSDNGIYDFWADRLRSHLVILQKDDFRDFVLYGTEVVTRNRLDKVTKTVERGALFSEELLPAESLLYSSVHATDLRLPKDKWNRFRSVFPLPYNDSMFSAEDVLRWLREHIGADRPIQVGGDETVGRGLVQLRWLGE
jgi:CRISPR-associated protein Cmr4